MFMITVVVIVALVIWRAYCYYLSIVPFGKKWNGEVVAILENGQIVPLKEAGRDFRKFFLPGATKTGKGTTLLVRRYVQDNDGVGWNLESSYMPRYCHLEIQQGGVVATFVDGPRDGIIGYELKIESEYPFKGSEPIPKYMMTDQQWYRAGYMVNIKR
jgi:hypothetical protein